MNLLGDESRIDPPRLIAQRVLDLIGGPEAELSRRNSVLRIDRVMNAALDESISSRDVQSRHRMFALTGLRRIAQRHSCLRTRGMVCVRRCRIRGCAGQRL